MHSKRNQDNIPIKIGGWDGKFVYEKPKLKDGYEVVKPSRGTLERQQWQEGKKEVIRNMQENQKSTTHSEQTTTSSSGLREHTIHIETETQYPNHGQQYQHSYNNEHLKNQNSNNHYANENQNQNRYNEQYQQDQQRLHQNSNQMQQNTSNAVNLHGYHTEIETLPPKWDGTFPPGYRNFKPKPNENRSNVNHLYGFSTEPTILPTQWDGKFLKSGETFLVPDRNQSATNNFYDYDNTPTVLPTTWNGEFQLDPNDVRIKTDRNASDVRDYADHRRFVTRE